MSAELSDEDDPAVTILPAGSIPVARSPRYIRTYSVAMVRWVKCRSTRARQAAGSTRTTSALSAASSSTESPSAPTSAEMISGSAPRWVPSTGVPLASASISVRPNGSSHSAGIQRHAAPASRPTFRAPPTLPTKRMLRRSDGRHPPASSRRRPERLAPSIAQR